jgi:hypothetical protein
MTEHFAGELWASAPPGEARGRTEASLMLAARPEQAPHGAEPDARSPRGPVVCRSPSADRRDTVCVCAPS